MAHISPISLWDTSAAEPEIEGRPLPEQSVDVAIVGGGFTGLSTALHCAELGLNAHVLEAERVGFGGSGRNVGLVNAAVWLPPAEVHKYLGPIYGEKFLSVFSDAPSCVFDLIERHQIRCEATRSGTLHCAHSASGLKNLQRRHKEWRRLGAPVHLLGKEETAALVGTKRFVGGLLDKRAGTINPMGYCRGLARAAAAAGAGISTGTRVASLSRRNGKWFLETSKGTVESETVVLGTNAYTDGLWPGLQRVFSTISYLQLATEPLEGEGEEILPERQGIWDTAPIMFNCRRDAFGRLLIGTMGRVIGDAGAGLTLRWAKKQLLRTFPQLSSVRIQHAWHGQFAMTPDHMPRIYNLDENLWTPIGYNGRGITTGTVFGKAMAELLHGMPPDQLPLPVARMTSAPLGRLRSQLFDGVFSCNQLLGSFR